jgi:hypothetical protein
MFQERTVNSAEEVSKGLSTLGLSFDTLKKETPDQQLLSIAHALTLLPDPATRNAAAFQLFGRSARELAPLLNELDAALARTSTLPLFTPEQAAMAKAIEMDLAAIRLQVDDLSTSIGRDLLPILHDVVGFVEQHKGLIPALLGPIEDQIQHLTFLYIALKKLSTVLPQQMTLPLQLLGAATSAPGPTGAALGLPGDENAAAAQAFLDKLSELAKKGIEVAAQNERVRAGLADMGIVMNDDAHVVEEMNKAWKESVDAAKAFQKVLDDVASAGTSWADTLHQMDGGVVAWSLHLLDIGVSLQTVAKYYGLTETQAKALEEQQKFLKSALDATTKAFANQVGLIVPRYSQFHEILTGVDDVTGDLAATTIESGTATFTFADAAAEAAKQTEALRKVLTAANETLAQGLMKTLEHVPQMMATAFTSGGGFKGAIAGVGSELGADLGKSIGSKIASFGKLGGPIGEAIGSLAGPLIDFFANIGGPSKEELAARDAFNSTRLAGENLNQTIQRMADELTHAGKSGPEALGMIQRALDATHTNAQAVNDAMKAINDVLADQKQDEADLKNAVDKYKFSIEELGPAMQKQQLDDQAKTLINDWRLLVGAGIDVSTVNEHMAQSMNDYLALARKTGTEVPSALEPILQKMIDQGLLTDNAGDKITDLAKVGVTFSETMTEGFQKVVDKLQQLIDKIGGVTTGLEKIPRSVDVDINGHYNGPDLNNFLPGDQYDPNAYGSAGGFVTPAGIQYLAGGNIVRPLSWARGTDTVHAMLTPGEGVLSRSAMSRLGRNGFEALNRGGHVGGDTINNFNITVEGSIRSDREITDVVSKGIMQKLDLRRRHPY